ncbi:eukaryotic translation initiation factor 5B isoform X2 [Scyliorhinus torazame]|uniref:Eukaryotic translation initiation factor 5B n=1 Tax=Scyliorhinus torazame TaxID=75743 RepID=A0A401PJG2_SCYTO|nr:hypothetical protein [Scyliorhinus torazame]
MGKKQKNKSEDNTKDDIDIDALAAEIEGAGAPKPKSASKKKKKDFVEDDILKEIEELALEIEGTKDHKETAKSSTANKEEKNDESELVNKKQDRKKKSLKVQKPSFEDDEIEGEESGRPKAQCQKQKSEQSDDDDDDESGEKAKGRTQSLVQKRELSEDEEVETKNHQANSISDEESDEFPQNTKNTRNQKGNQLKKGESEGEDEGDSRFKLKTAAQKKAEKKERERKKREEEKAKLRKQKEKDDSDRHKKEPDAKPPKSETELLSKSLSEQTDVTPADDQGIDDTAGAEGEENDGEKKKKDKKKKNEKEKKKAGPSKATVKAMQEALARLKEEEERQKRDEEERLKRLEELEAKRLEQEKVEQERREKKKQKEKERKERLKKEGKLLTKAQRDAKARAEATLELLRAQGVDVPSRDSMPKKRPVYDTRKKKKQQENKGEENKEEALEVISTPVQEELELEMTETPEEISEPTPEPEEKKSDADLDDWEAMASDHEQEKEVKTVHIEVKEEAEDEEDDEEEEEEDEEESDDEGASEESENEEKAFDETRTASARVGKESEVVKSEKMKLTKGFSSDSELESDSDDGRTKEERIYDDAKRRIEKRRAENIMNANTEKLRAPVICVLGHVDTGKTKILDKLRHTHVQDSEAGGITQQIGATNVPLETIKEQTKMVKNFEKDEIKIPGMLIIDTPGHESFSNLRNRGSSLCDIAILVVDIMHGLEPQTIESINLLKTKKCPFIVALNKIDRLYDWKKGPDADVVATLKKQKKNTKDEFDERAKSTIVEFAQQGLNAALFYENKDPRTFVSLIPTSAHTGDGMGNLIAMLVDLTQTMLAKRLVYSMELRAQVMEVKALPGMGTTIDVILINGIMKEGDTIIVPGVEGPIVTQIRGLLLPPPLKELRVKNPYEKQKEVWAAQGVKVLAKDLEKSLAGLPLLIAHKDDEIAVLKDELEHELKQTLNSIKLEEKGVYVQASTLGSLEALLEYLRASSVPYAGINIGPVHKKDVMKASAMLEHDTQYSVILAFDVKIERDSQELADTLGVRIFSAEIIYHLFDAFTKYRQDYKKQKQEEFKHVAVFPSKLRIIPQFIFNSRDPIVMGVTIEAGLLKQGTPVCVPSKSFIDIGIVTSIEVNHKQVDVARKGQEVCIKIEPIPGESPKMYGRHFEATDFIVSKISRQSIDALKNWFRDEMQKSDWQLVMELKKIFEII